MTSSHQKSSVLAVGVIVLITLGCSLELRNLARVVGLRIPGFPIPYGGAILDNTLAVLLVIIVALALLQRAPGRRLDALGLRWNGWRGPLLTLLATLPCWIGFAIFDSLQKNIHIYDVLVLSVVFPLAEEFVFRGFGFIFTRKVLRWPAALAVILQALVFGALHWSEGGSMVFLITMIGGIVFAALDMFDGYTIWSGLVLHVSLNATFNVFAVSNNAMSGLAGIVLRLASAAIALLLLWYFCRRHTSRAVAPHAT